MSALRMLIKRRSSGVSSYVDSLQLDEDKSSIGNVKTLRSKLQARRVTLNEAIEKEGLFLQGSQRLASLTTDPRSKDEATLQKDFAHSKIKTLQAELTKINSSLHAYQDEGAQGVQVPIIPLAMKTPSTIDFSLGLSAIISSHHYMEPEEFEQSVQKFNELRQMVLEIERSETGIRKLLEYYNQLLLVAKRLLNSRVHHNIYFMWYDAISGLPATQQSAVFERACILFNVGALYSQLAAKVDRKSVENIDTAIQYLEQAIGVFEYMKEKFSHSPMVDMTSELLALFSDLMRAQAQEMMWEKDILRRAEDEDISELDLSVLMDRSHQAKSVAECYRPVRELVDDEIIKKYLPDVWVALIKIKDAHYKAVAHYYAAMTHNQLAIMFEERKEVAEEVRTEVRFLYQDCPGEVMANHPKLHVGIMKSHINCAVLSHEYAVKFCNLCRDLHHMGCLTKMLAEGQALTTAIQEETADLEGVTMIAPTIVPCETKLSARPPNFKAYEVEDLFASLGPLPSFSGERQWSSPRCILLLRLKGSFGISVRGSQPVRVTSVDTKGSAEKAGVKVHDWVLAINSEDVKYKSHDEVVAMVKACKDEVTLLVTTPDADTAAETEATSPRVKTPCHSLVETHQINIT